MDVEHEDTRGLRWWERWLRPESRRSSVAAVASVLVAAPVVTVWLAHDPGLRSSGWTIGSLVAWTAFAAIHALLTFVVCRRMSRADLAESSPRGPAGDAGATGSGKVGPPTDSVRGVLARVGHEVRRGRREWDRWSDRQSAAPSWSVQVSLLALLVVAVILVTPILRGSQEVLFAALAMVAASWVNVLVMYTLHYARLDARAPGLAFPGEQPQELADYLYLALAVQTTFATTDVEIRTRALRRVAAGHGALAFAFNSVIIAMIVSLLLGVTP